MATCRFQPTFHLPVWVVLPASGPCTFGCELRPPMPGGAWPDWLAPWESAEQVRLPEPERQRLAEAFGAFGAAAPLVPEGRCLDGCRYRVEVEGERWEGNLGHEWSPAADLARLAVELAQAHARWRSTRAAFGAFALYV
jgi:hypothetical protein